MRIVPRGRNAQESCGGPGLRQALPSRGAQVAALAEDHRDGNGELAPRSQCATMHGLDDASHYRCLESRDVPAIHLLQVRGPGAGKRGVSQCNGRLPSVGEQGGPGPKVVLESLSRHPPVVAIGMRLHHDEVAHEIGPRVRDAHGGVTAHGLADERHRLIGERFDLRDDVVDEGATREVLGTPRRASVAPLINDEDAMVCGQLARGRHELRRAPGKTVKDDDGRAGLSEDVTDDRAVATHDGLPPGRAQLSARR